MKRMHSLIFAATTGILTLASSPLFAHGDESHDAQKAPNGGQLSKAGVYHFELVVAQDGKETKDNPVVVFVTDHAGGRIPTAGASGTATLLAGKAKSAVTLTPDGDNRMKGVAKYAATPDMKVVVSITLPGKATEQARFTPIGR